MHINGTTCSEAEWSMRVDLAAAYNIMDYLQLGEGTELPPFCIQASCRVLVHVSTSSPAAGICNHLSAVVPGHPDQFLLIAYGLGWQEVTPDNLLKCRVNSDGSFEVIEGNGTADKVNKQGGSVLV